MFILPGGNTTGPITVTTPNGSATSTTSFGVTLPGVQVTGLSPAQGKVNDFVFVFGAGFVTGATQVRLNSISAPLVQVLSPNLLLFMAPPGATTGPVSVTTWQGSATSTASFTVITNSTGSGSELIYLHTDENHIPRLATDNPGKIVWRWDGTAFGDTPPNEDPDGDGHKITMNLRYPGQTQDNETGLYYNWHRVYDPKIGRYLTPDPLGPLAGVRHASQVRAYLAGQPVGLEQVGNPYVYVRNNPLRWTDPEGREVLLGLVGAGIGGAWGLVNGYIAGDRGSKLWVDFTAGAATGGLAGLTNGFSLAETIVARSMISAGIESYRQLANSAISGCVNINQSDIALAGVTSIFGDLAGEAAAAGAALRATNRLQYNVPRSDMFSTVVGGNAAGAITAPYSAMQGSGR